jgi:triacylglycerol lipase
MNVVFASGFLVPQQILGINYFNGIEAQFHCKHDMLFHVVPPLGRSEQRARLMAKAINDKFPTGPIHIIAHSMGGLDSRHLIAANHHGLSTRIVSLTTLSTPHNGSPVADLLLGSRITRLLNRSVTRAISPFVDIGALEDLTQEGASKVPNVVQSHPQIHYRSYGAAGRGAAKPTCFALLLMHAYIGEPNDGLVAVDSAKYGEFKEIWPCDHADVVGHNLDSLDQVTSPAAHLARYDALIAELGP